MTLEQTINILRLSTYSDTCTLSDLRRAIGGPVITISTFKEAWIFVQTYRLAKSNESSNQVDDLQVIIDKSLINELL